MNVDLLRAVILTAHAAAGLAALGVGVQVVRAGRGSALLVGALMVMTALLIPSMALGWNGFGPVEKVVFPGLTVLAVVMVFHARLANRELRTHGRTARVIDSAGFCVISLTFAGSIVPLLRLGPVATVVGTGAAFLAVRAWVMRRHSQIVEASTVTPRSSSAAD